MCLQYCSTTERMSFEGLMKDVKLLELRYFVFEIQEESKLLIPFGLMGQPKTQSSFPTQILMQDFLKNLEMFFSIAGGRTQAVLFGDFFDASSESFKLNAAFSKLCPNKIPMR